MFDCFDAASPSNHALQLKFFAPLVFVQKAYRVTVTMVHRTNRLNHLSTVFSATLKDIQTPWTEYDFCQTEWSPPDSTQTNALFGTVTSHVCDGCKSETEISLSEATLEALSTSELSTDRVSSCEIRLYCNSLNFQLSHSYPINYDTLKIKVSESKGFLTVSCQRQLYSLEEERPCFTVSPDHQLSIVPASLDMKTMLSHSYMQMTREERHLVDSLHPVQFSSTNIKVKLFLQVFFECAMSSSFFSISFLKNIHCLIVINEILFDYQHKTPAIDLAFCFVDNLDIVKKFESVSKVRRLPLEEAGLKYLKEVLTYFSQRTNGTLLSAGSTSKYYAVLQKNDLDYAFTRCVLYLLLCDPDVILYASGDFLGLTTANYLPKIGGVCCACCNKLSFTAKKCGRCTQVSYCSKKCQTGHWKLHKSRCIPVAKHHLSSYNSHSQCTFCKKKFDTSRNYSNCACVGVQYCSIGCRKKHWPEHLETCEGVRVEEELAKPKCSYCIQSHSCMKKCTRCGQAQYCDRDCQRKHWSEHKKVCFKCPTTSVQTEKKSPTQSTCSLCKKSSLHLKKCGRCAKVQYCNRDCQVKDWPEHKKTCAEETSFDTSKYASAGDRLPECAHCKKLSDNLKKCTKCSNVQYCDRVCQTRDWPEHKKDCMKTAKVQLGSECDSSNSSQKCAYCKKASFSLKRCMKCEVIQYCSEDCLQNHWPEHKVLCSYITEMHQPLSSCAFCGSTLKKLLACKKCGKVKYCGKECQTKHWKEHKIVCTC